MSMAKRPTGRPSLLTPKRFEGIVKAVADGNFAIIAAQANGVSEELFHQWMRRGREVYGRLMMYEVDREPLIESDVLWMDFAVAVEGARAEAEVHYVGIIKTAAEEDWRPAAWWLERTRAGRYARQQRLETTIKGDPDSPVLVEVSAKDTLLERLSGIRERREAGALLLPARDDEVTVENAEVTDE